MSEEKQATEGITPIKLGTATISAEALQVVGWFDTPDQKEPTHDPWPGLCAVCEKTVDDPETVQTITIRPYENPKRSYFYRVHKTCVEDDQSNKRIIAFIDLMEMSHPQA